MCRQELRSARLHTAGPAPDQELPQKPFGLVDRAFLQAGAGRGGEAALAGHRSPVLQQEVELHRNSLRREADTALRLAGDIRWVHASHYRLMLTSPVLQLHSCEAITIFPV